MSFDRSPSLGQVINTALERAFEGLRVSCPGEIQSFDSATQLAQVKPLVKGWRYAEDGSRVLESLPVLNNVPVAFLGGGGLTITFPLQKGDPVFLIFSDRSLDEWIQQGGDTEPQHFWTHHLSDAVAIPAVRSKAGALSGLEAGVVSIGKEGSASDFAALAAKVDTRLGHLEAAYNAHQHLETGGTTGPPNVVPGVSPVENPAGSGLVGSTASAAVKIRG